MTAWKASKFAYLAVVLGGTSLTGCAIHTQGQIKELAYDFSDRDFYDRAYAPSPSYDNAYVEYRDASVAPLAQSAATEPVAETVEILPPPDGLPLEAGAAMLDAGLVRQAR